MVSNVVRHSTLLEALTVNVGPSFVKVLAVFHLRQIPGFEVSISVKGFFSQLFIVKIAKSRANLVSRGKLQNVRIASTHCVSIQGLLTKISPLVPSESLMSIPGTTYPIDPCSYELA